MPRQPLPIELIRKLVDGGMTVPEAAAAIGANRKSVSRVCRDNGITQPRALAAAKPERPAKPLTPAQRMAQAWFEDDPQVISDRGGFMPTRPFLWRTAS